MQMAHFHCIPTLFQLICENAMIGGGISRNQNANKIQKFSLCKMTEPKSKIAPEKSIIACFKMEISPMRFEWICQTQASTVIPYMFHKDHTVKVL